MPLLGLGTGFHATLRAPGWAFEAVTVTPVGAAGTKSALYDGLAALGAESPMPFVTTTEKRNVCSGSRSVSVQTVDSPQSFEYEPPALPAPVRRKRVSGELFAWGAA